MTITATHINLYNVCHRELWLHAHEIRMEHTSDIVFEGKLLHETAYPQRAEKGREMEIRVSFGSVTLSAKIDFVDLNRKIIHETKKSDKLEHAHEAQLKFYILVLELSGATGVTGLLEYPSQKKKKTVTLSLKDRESLEKQILQVKTIIEQEKCPDLIKKSFCKTCSYFDFCWIREEV